MRSQPRAGLVVLGLALISLTPVAPGLVRFPDLLAVQLFRPLDALVITLRERSEQASSVPIPGQDQLRIRRGLEHRNRTLRSGAEHLVPDRRCVLARVVEVDLRLRRLLVDAGPGADLRPGAPVLAGTVGLGRVISSQHGVAVVETLWTPEARFAAACTVGEKEQEVRFVLSGLDRAEWSASVRNPERKSGLVPGEPVYVPDVKDLVPDSIQLLPAGLRLGRLAEDRTLARTGHKAFCVVPELDLMLLDAVVVITGARLGDPVAGPDSSESSDGSQKPAGWGGPEGFEASPVEALWCGLASPWRDGLTLTGFGLPELASVSVDGRFAGVIQSRLIDVARVRGVSDPGQRFPVLVVGEQVADTLFLESIKTWPTGALFRVLAGASNPVPGDLLLSAGRGAHVPRGQLIGRVVACENGLIELGRRPLHVSATVEVWRRPGFPARPWELAR